MNDEIRGTSGGNDPRDTPATMEKSDTEDYADEWDDLDEKVILVQILSELQQIRMALTNAETRQDDAEQQYRCTHCGATVPADERERHAQSSHKAPGDMIESLFEPVE